MSLKLTKTYTPYDRYTDSGVAWLGQVPEGWEVLKLKSVVNILNGATPKSDSLEYWDGDINWVTPVDLSKLKSKYITDTLRKITKQGYLSCGTKIIPQGNIIMSCRAPIGLLAINSVDSTTNQGCKGLVIRKKTNTEYLYYLLSSLIPVIQFHGNGSTFSEIKNNDLGSIVISLPPLPTQQRIATYLDEKTEKIDRIIDSKKRLVELLEEKRKSVISEAVESVSDVKREKLKFVCSINIETLPETTYPDLSINYIDIGNVNNKGKIIDKEIVNFSDAPSRARRIVQNDDVIIATVRTYLKAIAYFENPEDNTIVSTGFAVLTPTKKVLGKYLYYKILSKRFVDLVVAHSTGVSYPAINPTQLGNLFLEYPSIERQKQIVAETDKKIQEIEKVIKKVKQSIKLLTEYKSSLISHVVTGRVRV